MFKPTQVFLKQPLATEQLEVAKSKKFGVLWDQKAGNLGCLGTPGSP